MNWTKLEVYNNDEYLGSFYTNETTKHGVIREINEKYGKGDWTKYNIGNQCVGKRSIVGNVWWYGVVADQMQEPIELYGSDQKAKRLNYTLNPLCTIPRVS